jgi:uncharacterized protein
MTFRILSLDGGGPWALLQAMALERLYPGLDGHAILGRFDLAVANSGGSITLAGLVKGLRPREIAGLFLDRIWRERIFVRREGGDGFGDPLAAWSAAGKRAGLQRVIDEGLVEPLSGVGLSDAARFVERRTGRAIRLMIAAYDLDRNRGRFFRSFQSALSTESPAFEPSLVDAVHASTHAPVVYFAGCAVVRDRNRPGDERRFWDGALGGVNNPVLAGVVEARALGEGDVAALSLGTGSTWRPIAPASEAVDGALLAQAASLRLVDGLRRVAGTILEDPPDNATRDADVLASSGDEMRVVRLNPLIRPVRDDGIEGGRWRLPAGYAAMRPGEALGAFVDLRDMPMDAVGQAQVELIAALGRAWLAGGIPNQPLRWNPTDGTFLRGHPEFAGALACWRLLDPWRP